MTENFEESPNSIPQPSRMKKLHSQPQPKKELGLRKVNNDQSHSSSACKRTKLSRK